MSVQSLDRQRAMDDPFFGRWWDRFPQRSSQCNRYSSYPYSAANVTPTKPEYAYRGAPKIKPRTFTVPVQGPPDHPSPNSSTVTKESSPPKPKSKNVISIPINTKAPKSSSGIKKAAAPRMDETSAAIKMQSVFRGFSGRKGAPLKNLRVIREVKAEAETIRRRLADRQVVELILQKEKERLKMSEGIMSLLLKLDAIQGVNSFVRELRKAAIRELLNLEEIVDAIIAGKLIQETVSMAAQAAENDNHAKEMVASGEENGEGQCSYRGSNEEEVKDEVLDWAKLTSANDSEMLERDPNEKEIRDEEVLNEGKLVSANDSQLLQRCPNEGEIRDEEMLDGVKLTSANDSEVQGEVSVLSDTIENQNMQIEIPNHAEGDSVCMGDNGGGESHEMVASGEAIDLKKENKLQDQEFEPRDEGLMADSIYDEKCTDDPSSCEGRTGELRALQSHSIPCTDEEIIRHSIDVEEFHNSASDSEVQACKRLKASDCSQTEAETIQADEQQRDCEGMDYEETGEVIEAGAGENARVEEDVVKVKEENERLKKMVVDMFKKNEFQNEMITNLSLKIAQLEEQISKSKRKKTGDKTKKMKESSNDSNSGRSKTE